jgi:HK97 family phage prohead protease
MNHDANIVLGRTRSGTLVLSDSRDGLRFLCQLDKSQQSHKDLYASVKRGDISECSFAFAVNGEGQTWTRDQKQRTLTDVNLFDVSIVTNPAYPTGTSVQVRSAQYRSAARPRTESEMLQLMDVFHRARVKQIGFLIRMADATERMNIHMAQTIHDQQSARVAKLGQEIREQQGPGMDDEDISASERERMVH